MPSGNKTIKRYRKIIIFLSFVVLILSSILFKSFQNLAEIEKPVIDGVATKPPTKIEQNITGKIAIVIDDFGYRNDAISDGFLSLESKLTYAVIPGHEQSRSAAEKAIEKGFEIIVHMPMETNTPSFGEDEYRLSPSMTSREIEETVNRVLDHLPEAVGMNNHQGSKATADKRVMNVLGTVLKDNGKYFLDSRTTTHTQAETTMRSLGVPTGRRHVFLDNDFDEELIRMQFDELADIAKKRGFAVGIGHVKLHTLNVLKREIIRLKNENYEFVYVSEIVK